MKALRQIAAIVRTELRFALRRGWPVVGVAVIGLAISAATFYLALANMEGLPRDSAAESSARDLAMVWPAFQWLVLGVVPMVSAPAIPLDRQFGVNELLHSLPLTGAIYLLGKVLGTVIAVLATGAATLALYVVLHLVLLGPLRTELYLALILFSALPLLVWAPAVGVLAASGLQTRRRAVLVGTLVGFASPLCWGLRFLPPADLRPFEGAAAQLSHQPISDLILYRYGLLPPYTLPPTESDVIRTSLLALSILLAASLFARLQLHLKEDFR